MASHLFQLSSSSPTPHQQIMETLTRHSDASGSQSSRLVGATSNTSIIAIQQEQRHQVVPRETGNAATKQMPQHTHLKIVSTTGSSKNKKLHTVECEYIHIVVNSHQITV